MQGPQVGVGLVLRVPPPVVGQRLAVPVGVRADDQAVGGLVAAGRVLVDVVAQVQHHVGLPLGEPAVAGEVALLVVWSRTRSRTSGPAPCPARGRYGSGRRGRCGRPYGTGRSTPGPGRRPPSSTCTLCAHERRAVTVPVRTTRVNLSSSATCHSTATSPDGIPPCPSSARGSGARRVHRTMPSGAGSPEATPSVNGSWGRRGTRGATASAAAPTSSFLRVRCTRPLQTACLPVTEPGVDLSDNIVWPLHDTSRTLRVREIFAIFRPFIA